ncbi:MAG: GGDEF domain-containing protein [Deltaproteobacteria bacterium]
MAVPPDETDESWQQRTHVIRMGPIVRAKAAGNDCLVIIYARDTAHLGKRFVLDGEAGPSWVGRGGDNSIMLESDTCSRKHAYFEASGESWFVVDHNSTNGTYVNDDLIQRAALKRGDHIKIGDTIFKYLAGTDVEAEFVETIREVMMRDGLTQAYNRRHLSEQIEKELHRARRYRRPLAMVMMDLDHFKRVNDTFGHLAGDFVLRESAGIIRERTPAEAVFARYGGEEFALLMPETALPDALRIAEDVRAGIASHHFTYEGQRIEVTVSLGVALATEAMQNTEEFIKIADAKLYAAKHAGRNRVMS